MMMELGGSALLYDPGGDSFAFGFEYMGHDHRVPGPGEGNAVARPMPIPLPVIDTRQVTSASARDALFCRRLPSRRHPVAPRS
jgi:hypothetical protein